MQKAERVSPVPLYFLSNAEGGIRTRWWNELISSCHGPIPFGMVSCENPTGKMPLNAGALFTNYSGDAQGKR